MYEYSVAVFRFCSRLGSNPMAGHGRNFPCQSERVCQCCVRTYQLGHGLRRHQNLPEHDGEYSGYIKTRFWHLLIAGKTWHHSQTKADRSIQVIHIHNCIQNNFNVLNWIFFQSVLTSAGTFWLFAFMCIFNVIFTIAFIPETKGKTLEQIEATFRGTSGPWIHNLLTLNHFLTQKKNLMFRNQPTAL